MVFKQAASQCRLSETLFERYVSPKGERRGEEGGGEGEREEGEGRRGRGGGGEEGGGEEGGGEEGGGEEGDRRGELKRRGGEGGEVQ